MSRRLLGRLCVLALLVAPQPVLAAWRACPGVSVARPAAVAPGMPDEPQAVPDNAIGCRHGTVLRLDDATIWRCQVVPKDGEDDLPEGTPPYAFMIDRPGAERRILPDDLMAGRYRSFDVLTVDLDGDGKPERVLAAWNSQSNGLGVNRWTIRVFDRDWTLLHQFDDVSDWGDSSLARAPAGRRGCDLAITSFVNSVNRRGVGGISFQARFYSLRGEKMEPATDRPAVQRRYDFAFERERTAHFRRSETEERGNPGRWLARARPSPAPQSSE